MKAKEIVTLVLITFLLSFAQKSFSQNWDLWFTENEVDFLINFVPEQENQEAYFHLKLVSKSADIKTIYFYPVYVYDDVITGTCEKRNFFLKPGTSYEEKFYITQQSIIQAGNHIPDVTFKEYYVKEY
jgi:hypothetical protein